MDDVRIAPADTTQRDLQVRAAWFYYVEGLTQEQIARTMAISRAKVVRLLVAARTDGVVRIRVGAKGGEQVALERGLVARFGLAEAVVVAVPAGGDTAGTVGHAAGVYLQAQLRDGLTVGVGWGATLSGMLPALGESHHQRVAVVSLLGGMTHSRAVNPSAVARRLADALHADCYQLTAPLVVSDEATRDALWAERALRELQRRARHADVALVGVGHVSEDATLFREGLLPREELASLRAAGAVGDVLCRFVDADGRSVDHPINRRVVGIDLAELRRVPRIVVAAGGTRKVAAVRAALKALPVQVLVTDEAVAAGLLAG